MNFLNKMMFQKTNLYILYNDMVAAFEVLSPLYSGETNEEKAAQFANDVDNYISELMEQNIAESCDGDKARCRYEAKRTYFTNSFWCGLGGLALAPVSGGLSLVVGLGCIGLQSYYYVNDLKECDRVWKACIEK